eukprot:m.264184 g.264184  ORF g.264184 m.264184 type:complete len:398 (-) comp54475_c0_seq1:215-1408(-)
MSLTLSYAHGMQLQQQYLQTHKPNLNRSNNMNANHIDEAHACVFTNPFDQHVASIPRRSLWGSRQPKTIEPLTSIVVQEAASYDTHHNNQTNVSGMSLSWLPSDVIEKICFLCDASTLLAVSSTCKRLKSVADSDRVWRRILLREMRSWRSLKSTTMPGHQQLFFNVKTTYLSCSPESKSPMAAPFKCHKPALWLQMYQSLGRSKPLKIVMFGIGLEHAGTGIVRDMFYSGDSMFDLQGMIPGIQRGNGGGVTLRHKELGTSVDMVALYHRRTRAVNQPVPKSSSVVCADADAFICVVDDTMLADPTTQAEHQQDSLAELQALLPKSSAPLLVISCAPGFTSGRCLGTRRRCGTVDVANLMRLGAQPRPWAVEALAVGNQLSSMSSGIEWLLCNAAR